MKTIVDNLVQVTQEKPLQYKVKHHEIYAALWEVFIDGELVEMTPLETATVDLQHRILQAYIDCSQGRAIDNICDALDYAEYLVNDLGLNTRLKDRVQNEQLSQALYQSLSHKEVEELMKVANQEYFLNIYPAYIFENVHKPLEELMKDAKD